MPRRSPEPPTRERREKAPRASRPHGTAAPEGEAPAPHAAPHAALRRALAGPGAPLGAADVLALQRSVGNAAVGRLLKGRAGAPRPGAVQRDVINWMPAKYEPPIVTRYRQDGNQQGLEYIKQLTHKANWAAKFIDDHATEAHGWVQKVTNDVISGATPLTGMVAALDNVPHAQDYANKLGDMLAGVPSMHPSAAGGYVIEDYASEKVGEDALTQVTPPELNRSRPDFIYQLEPMNLEDGFAALYDITSASRESVGHVLTKGGGSWIRHQKYPYVAEIVYPPLRFDGTTGRQLSAEELKLVQDRVDEKMAVEEEAATEYREKFRVMYEGKAAEAVNRLNGGNRGWMKLQGRRGTSVLLDAGISQGAGGWEMRPFGDWWGNAEDNPAARKALETVAAWIGG